jgi:hypothetical protein
VSGTKGFLSRGQRDKEKQGKTRNGTRKNKEKQGKTRNSKERQGPGQA